MDQDSNESLSDFRLYAEQARQRLTEAGIGFRVLYVHSFCVRVSGRTTTFHPKTDVGYYLIAPGKEPDVEYGVMTDTDLFQVAKRYFGLK
jgi:hypothetical protein